MREVLRHLAKRRHREALVRLWVLAGKHDGTDTRLNRWEREQDPKRHDSMQHAFFEALENNSPIAEKEASDNPLALIRAVDDMLAAFSGQRHLVRKFACELEVS